MSGESSTYLEHEKGASELDLRALLGALMGHKWLILGCTLVVGGLVLLWTSRQPRVYEATSTVEYDPNPVRPLGREIEDVADPMGNYWRSQEFFQTQNHILQSRVLSERVVQRLGLHHDPGFTGYAGDPETFPGVSPEAAAGRLQGRISVAPVNNTRLVRVSVTDSSPERAQLIVNTLIDAFVEKTIEDRLGSTVNALEWLGTQLDSLRGELNAAELALHEFKEDHNVLSVSLEDQRNLVAQELQHFHTALTAIRARRIALQARIAVVRDANRADPMSLHAPAINEDQALVALRTRILEKEQERDRLSVRYGENHPDLQQIDAQLTTLRRQHRLELDRVIDTIAADLREVRSTETGLRAALEEANAAGLHLNMREIEYTRLERERQNKAQVYALVLQRATEADLTRMLQTTYIRVVDRALRPASPIRPSLQQNALAGLAGGLALGIALSLLLSRLDRRIRTVTQAEGFGVPVLGILPRLPGSSVRGRSRSRAGRKGGMGARSPHSPVQDLVVHTQPSSAAAECCRAIRTNLAFMSVEHEIRTLVVTSARPEEGKTTVAVSMAISLAQGGKRVLLVDTDLRRPQVHRAFGLDSSVGITSVLAGEVPLRAAIRESGVPGLSVLAAGPIPPNPAELLHSRAFAALAEELRQGYDLTLFDSPPVSAVTDASILAPQADGVLLVGKLDQTTRDDLRGALRQLGGVSAHVLGLVLNDVDLSLGGAYAQSYYRYGEYAAEAAEAHPNAAE